MKTSELEKEICEFILWLCPCGQVQPAPTVETIGREARKLQRKIIRWQKERIPYRTFKVIVSEK